MASAKYQFNLLKMKKLKLSIPALLIILSFLTNCSKDCDTQIVKCSDSVPVNELCQAAFQRWFYDKEQNKCTQVGYSGCSAKGFGTQQECEACRCNK